MHGVLCIYPNGPHGVTQAQFPRHRISLCALGIFDPVFDRPLLILLFQTAWILLFASNPAPSVFDVLCLPLPKIQGTQQTQIRRNNGWNMHTKDARVRQGCQPNVLSSLAFSLNQS